MVTVELSPGDKPSLLATCGAVLRADAGATCAAVLLAPATDAARNEFKRMVAELSGPFGDVLHGYDNEQDALSALAGGKVGLLHVAMLHSQETALPDLGAWVDTLTPGAVIAVTTTASDVSSDYVKAKRHLTDTFPAVSIALGLTTEAVVAQCPVDGVTPIVDILRRAPFAVGAFLALSGEQIELHHLLQDEPEPSPAARALIGRVIDQHHVERDAFLSVLRVYKEETVRLTNEVAQTRSELSGQIEAARLEREQLVGEFLNRVDHLASKLSTSSSRYEAELAKKDVLIADAKQRVEVYAGLAADAQSVVDDIRRSSSWRATAPVRLLSRMLARRAVSTPVQPEEAGRRIGH